MQRINENETQKCNKMEYKIRKTTKKTKNKTEYQMKHKYTKNKKQNPKEENSK